MIDLNKLKSERTSDSENQNQKQTEEQENQTQNQHANQIKKKTSFSFDWNQPSNAASSSVSNPSSTSTSPSSSRYVGAHRRKKSVSISLDPAFSKEPVKTRGGSLGNDNLLPTVKSSSKKFIPPPLDLSRSITPSSSPPPTVIPTHLKRPPTPLSDTSESSTSTDLAHLILPNISSNSLTPTPSPTHLYIQTNSNDHAFIKPIQEDQDDLSIEDEERQAAEWMGSSSNNSNNWNFDNSFNNHDLVHRLLNSNPMVTNSHQTQDEDSDLTTMEKIFLFAKSENSHHRLIVSQRLPELLEQVDITEAVEYVLPLLSELTQDEQKIREALAPSFCNIMWYYLSRCPLIHTQDECLPDPSGSINSSVDGCNSLDSSQIKPRKRPHISLNSFTTSLVTLLTDTDCSIGLLTRSAFIIFLCRLVNHPLPDWSEDLKLLYGESLLLPLEYYNTSNNSDNYQEYTFDEPIRFKIAFELVASVFDDLCGIWQTFNSSSRPHLDHNGSNELDDWDPVPSNLDPRITCQIMTPNPSSNLLSARLSSSVFDPPPSQVPLPNFNSMEPLDYLHRQQVGLILIESIAQARCLDPNFLYDQLLPKLIHGTFLDQNCRALRQQIASTLTTIIINLSSNCIISSGTHENYNGFSQESELLLVDLYRSFASDSDPEVRKQIVLGLPALIKFVHHRSRAQLSLELMEQFNRDENREVRIVGCQILGELIHVFHLSNSNLPNQLVEYFLSGFENNERQMTREEFGQVRRMSDGSDIFGGHITTSSPRPLDEFTDLTQDAHLAPHTSSSFGTSGLSVEHTERAMCCSYNFPAVLLTLGVQRWEELRHIFLKLATDVTYPPKIRRSLARSMHEVIKLIRAPSKQFISPSLLSLAIDDWLKVLRFFLFEDQELTNTESILETLDISLNHSVLFLFSLQDSQRIITTTVDIIDKLSDYFIHNNGDQTLYNYERQIGWTLREKVVLLLPQLFKNLKHLQQHIYCQKNRNDINGSAELDFEKKLERCFESLLFLGLHDPACAVREAALEFVPIFFTNFDFNFKQTAEGRNDETMTRNNRIKKEEFQKKLIQKLKLLSFNSNYRVRMIYPKALLNLVKNNSISIHFFEKEVLNHHQFIEISKDKVSGVRISLGRLIHQLCHSQEFYYPHFSNLDQFRLSLPKNLQKLMFILSNDPESIVRSFIESSITEIQQRGDNLKEEEVKMVRTRRREEDESLSKPLDVEQGSVTMDKEESKMSQTTHETNKSILNIHYTNNDIKSLDSLEDDDSDDLSGSGIKVEDETRLSEDEGVQIGLGGEEIDFFNSCSSEDDDERNREIFITSNRQDFDDKGKKSDMSSSGTLVTDNHHRHQDYNYLIDNSSSSLPFVKLNSPGGSGSCSEEEEEEEDQLVVSDLNELELGFHKRLVDGPIPGPSSDFSSTNITKLNIPFNRSSRMPRKSHLHLDLGASVSHLDSDLTRLNLLPTRSIEIDPQLTQTSNNDNDRLDSIRRSISEPVSTSTTPRIRPPALSSSSSPSRNHYSTPCCWDSNSNQNSFPSSSYSSSSSSSSASSSSPSLSSFSSSSSRRDTNQGLVVPHSSSSNLPTRREKNITTLNNSRPNNQEKESDLTIDKGRRNSDNYIAQKNSRNEQDYSCMTQNDTLPHPTLTTRANSQHFTPHPHSSSSTTNTNHPIVARLMQTSIPSSNSHSQDICSSGDQIWMRETDGGFVEVGEY